MTARSKSKRKRDTSKAQTRPTTKVLASFDDPTFTDIPEHQDRRRQGAKQHKLVAKVSTPCTLAKPIGKDDDLEKWRRRCRASAGCGTFWSNTDLRRIAVHSKSCPWLPIELRNETRDLCAERGYRDKDAQSGRVRSIQQPVDDMAIGEVEEKSTGQLEDDDSDTTLAPTQTKRQRTGDDHGRTEPRVHEGGLEIFHKRGREELKKAGDHALMLFLICNGIPPRNADSKFLAKFTTTLNPRYSPPCSTTIRDYLVPSEASIIQIETLAILRQYRNLTLSFDGGKTRRPHGIYTINVTTPDCRSFLMDLADVSGVSHTAEYLQEIINPVRTDHV